MPTNETMNQRTPDGVFRENLIRARQEGAVLDDPAIIAKPLNMPGPVVKLKDSSMLPYMAFRGSGAKTTRRVVDLQRKGFRLAVQADLVDAGLLDTEDGHYTNGDLILMVVKKSDYYAYQKNNAQRAQEKVGRKAMLEAGAAEVRQALNNPTDLQGPDGERFGVGTVGDKQKITVYEPGEKDLPAKFASVSK